MKNPILVRSAQCALKKNILRPAVLSALIAMTSPYATGTPCHSLFLKKSTQKASVGGYQYFIPDKGEGLVTFHLPDYQEGKRTHVVHMTFGTSTPNVWNVGAMRLANTAGYLDSKVDLLSLKARYIFFEYRSTADAFVQLRPSDKTYWNGGQQWTMKLPSTEGQRTALTVSLSPEAWSDFLFDKPEKSFDWVLSRASSLVFVGNVLNEVTFYNIAIENYIPVQTQ